MAYKDNEQEAVKKTFGGEKKKLSQMTFGQKIEYITEYYRLHILVIILILGAVGWGVHHALTYVQYKFYGMIINSAQYDKSIEDDLRQRLSMDKHDGLSITAELSSADDANMGGYGSQLDILIMTGQMDFAFTDEAGVEHLVDMGVIRPLDKTLPKDLYQDWAGDNRIYTAEYTDDDGNTDTYQVAADISGTKIQQYFGLDDNTKYLVIADLSGSEDYMENFYNLLKEMNEEQ